MFNLTRISQAKHRNCGFVTLSVTISRRFRVTICADRMSGELVRMRVIILDEYPTPLRSHELMRVVGETTQPEFVGLWPCKPESRLKRTHAETEAAALLRSGMAKQPMMSNKLAKGFAWNFCAVVALVTMWQIANEALNSTPRSSLLAILTHASYTLIPLAFSALGALVISRQPHNTIGWWMLAPALANVPDAFSTPFLSNVTVPPSDPSSLFLV